MFTADEVLLLFAMTVGLLLMYILRSKKMDQKWMGPSHMFIGIGINLLALWIFVK
ncbi:hypothetical protein [Deinococcus misasensis]|uniref:hypothetical protein n=1 Tax=Deinococcus misasensis TaxID=392413 RepID=UPI000A4146B3|nr:hypothetical protein [Deinococcus misasensis]